MLTGGKYAHESNANPPGTSSPTLCLSYTFGLSAVAALLLCDGSISLPAIPSLALGAAGQAAALHRQDGLSRAQCAVIGA